MKLLQPRIPLKEKMFFVEHLAVMLKASIPIDRALATLAEQTRHKGFKKILTAILEQVRKGGDLSQGMQPFQPAFGPLFINMVQAGELSGKLEEGLRRLYTQVKKDYELKSRVKSALTYPAFVVVAMLGIGGVIMVVVVPKLIPLFEGFNAELPLATKILIGLSKFISRYIFLVLVIFVVAMLAAVKLLRGPWRRPWHGLLLHLPIFGQLIKKVNLARCARTLSTLLSTDILVVEALTITARTLGNEHYKTAITEASEEIKKGLPIAGALQKHPALFPPTIHTMVQVGEESGTLTELLDEVAQFYEESVDEATKNIASIIEPVLIVLLGAAVGGLALAILMPMYSLMQQI